MCKRGTRYILNQVCTPPTPSLEGSGSIILLENDARQKIYLLFNKCNAHNLMSDPNVSRISNQVLLSFQFPAWLLGRALVSAKRRQVCL